MQAKWIGWFRREAGVIVVHMPHDLGATPYAVTLYARPTTGSGGDPFYCLAGGNGGYGPASVLTTANHLYLHFEADAPAFGYLNEQGAWETFDEADFGAYLMGG